jgi:hypothetical protein
MRRLIFPVLAFLSIQSQAQTDTATWLRAFPITDYMVALNDSTKVVQLEMPDGLVIKEKQLGMLYGVYNGSRDKAVQKGYGRCHLIKGNYYYFAIGHNTSGLSLEKGDLVYTMMDKTPIYYGRIPKIAAHFIRLQNVYETPLFDRYTIFSNWTEKDEKNIVDSMVADIRFTGKYFSENNPSMDVLITSGDHKGKKTFYMMIQAQPALVHQFLDYMIARPRLYAGREWKIAELFATWLSEGAPTVLKD